MVLMDFELGDILQLRKLHPCGSCEWEVVRLGADIGIKCLKCRHMVLLERRTLERRVKGKQRIRGTNEVGGS